MPGQPWGIFFVKFEPKRLPVVALRRILGQVALKKRASANKSERQAWAADDLLFVSNYGEGEERRIAFAHFSKPQDGHDLPTLKVLGWDNLDTPLHLDAVARELTDHLTWPDDEGDPDAWRERWRAAFQAAPPRGHHHLEGTLRAPGRAGPRDPRPHPDGARHRDRVRAAHQAHEGVPDRARPRPGRGRLRRHVRPDHRIRPALGSHHRPRAAHRRRLRRPHADEPVPPGADGDLPARGGRRGKAGGPGIDFDELGVSEVVELLDRANMEAVVRDFGDRNPQEDPVIHFYEHFLAAYDKKQKVSRGVFYTPRPVVSYIVRSVDELLRTEFGLADGLADTTTWGEMAERHEGTEDPRRTLRPDRPSSRSSTRPPAPVRSSSR